MPFLRPRHAAELLAPQIRGVLSAAREVPMEACACSSLGLHPAPAGWGSSLPCTPDLRPESLHLRRNGTRKPAHAP